MNSIQNIETTQNTQTGAGTNKYTSARKHSPYKHKTEQTQNRKLSEDRANEEEERKIPGLNDSRRNSSLSFNRGAHGGSVISNSNKDSEISSHEDASLTPKDAI